MNKREVVWLIVKLIGTYFVYSAIVAFFSLVGSISALYSLPSETTSPSSKNDADVSAVSPITAPDNFPTPMTATRQSNTTGRNAEKTTLDPAMKKARDEAIKNLLWYIFLTALYGAIGFYLIRDGRVLFALLSREGKIVSEEKEINSLGIYDDAK